MSKVFSNHKSLLTLCLIITISHITQVVVAQTNGGIFGIYATTPKGSQGGTAFLVSSTGDIVTAYHVVQNATLISIQDANKGVIDTRNVSIRAIDPKRDIAIINIPSLAKRKSLELKSRFPKPAEGLRVIGYPRGMVNSNTSLIDLTADYIAFK